MREPKRQTKAEMMAENRERIARLCGEIIEDVRSGVPDGKLEINLTFMERLLSQRRRIRQGQGGT